MTDTQRKTRKKGTADTNYDTMGRVRELLVWAERRATSQEKATTTGRDIAVGAGRVRSRLGCKQEPEVTGSEHCDEDLERLLANHADTTCRVLNPSCAQCVLHSFCGPVDGDSATGEPTVLELFSGAGGLSHGFKEAGYRVAGAVELNRDAAQTFRLNNPGVPVLEADVSTLDLDALSQLGISPGSIDVLAAGPPCQGYSAAGRRDPGDPQNQLYKEVSRIARLLRPKLVVVENVLGLRQVNGVRFARSMQRSLNRSGYRVTEPMRLKAVDFGVPQSRERLVYVARRTDLGAAVSSLAPTHVPYSPDDSDAELPMTPSLLSVLEDLPQLDSGAALEFGDWHGTLIANASTMKHSAAVIEKIASIPQGGGPISYRRLSEDVARTLVAGHRAFPVHPTLDRAISVREAARIQGFPDDFVFAGCRSNQPLQVANAVPPPMSRALAVHLRDYLAADS